MSDPLIQIKNLYKIYGSDPASVMRLLHEGVGKNEILARTGQTLGLNNISLDIGKGSTSVIMGLSGSGKSTLIRHLNRLIEPTEGIITVEGADIMQLTINELESFRRHRISMVFQRFALMPHYTVLDNIAFGLKMQQSSQEYLESAAHHWMTKVGLDGYENQYPANLSGGEQQRVGLARALCMNTDILLMDEPFSALDPLIRTEMQDLLMTLNRELNKTVVFITHDPDEALKLGDQIALLKDGAIVQTGSPKDILLNPVNNYVKDFVRDVSRTRVFSVRDLMKPETHVTAETDIKQIRNEMENWKSDYAFIVRENRLKGIVRRQALQQMIENGRSDEQDILKITEETPVLRHRLCVQDALSVVLETDYPVPVLEESGVLCGTLSTTDLIPALTSENDRRNTFGKSSEHWI
ncbi:MAG: quaternary amine ABC transporter ATP-binding protein, partial [Desulfobulbia bacterium]